MDSKILIVDDDKSIRKGLSLALDDKYRTITAGDGLEALRLFENERPDIVLLDVGPLSSLSVKSMVSISALVPGKSNLRRPSLLIMIARSITFCSSRILPGQ